MSWYVETRFWVKQAKHHGHGSFHYPRQEGYVIVVVCLSVCLLAAILRKNVQTDLHEIFREGWPWTNEQTIKFWWRPGSQIRILIRVGIATLVRRALAEVCTVPVLLVLICYCSETHSDTRRINCTACDH